MSTSQTSDDRRLNRQAAVITAGVIVALILTAATALGAGVYKYTNAGAIKSVRTATTTGDAFSTDSTTFLAISGSQVNLTVASRQKALLIITFSAESRCSGSGACHLAAYVDGIPVDPGDIYFDSSVTTGLYQARSFQWVSGVLSPGPHTVAIAGRVDAGSEFLLDHRTLTVLSAKAV